MYCVRKVTDDLTWVGGNDRRLALFEGVYDVPKGVSYNSYLLMDEKTVLFDTVDHSVDRLFFENIDHVLAGRKLAIVPILRAGLGMVDGILQLVPAAKTGHIGLERDHDTLKPREYYCKLPSDISQRDVLLLDPMLATGGSASAAIQLLKEKGVRRLSFVCVVAAPEGVERITREHPEIPIYCAALDQGLNENGYIVPGLGDAGDRIFGTE